MKVRCPGCGKEYPRPALPPGQSATVRCRACGSMFRLSAPLAPSPAPAAPKPAPAARQPMPVASPTAPAAPTAGVEPVFRLRGHTSPQPGAQVLIADEARPFRESLLSALQSLGATCAVVDDGETALTYVQEQRPRLLLVNVYLRRLLGIIVCERVKADPLLSATRVVLIGALFRKDRYVREPDQLYGADDYIEEGIKPEDLRQRLSALLGPVASGRAPGVEAKASPVPDDLQRLIRIILSDIMLYNAERAENALRNGEFQAEFKVELEEGMHLIQERFPSLAQASEIYLHAVEQWLAERGRVLVR